MDLISDVIAAGALLLSVISLGRQGTTRYRNRRRLIVEVLPSISSMLGPPERQETHVAVYLTALGGTMSTREMNFELPRGSSGFAVSPVHFGPNFAENDTRALIDRLADPMHVRRTLH